MTRAASPGQSALLLLDVVDILNALRVSYAIIGAFAASFYGVVRASLDADALISLRPREADATPLIEALRTAGFTAVYTRGNARDPVGAVLTVEDPFGNRVDLLMGIQGMTEAVFTRTVESEFMNVKIRVVGIEDFIAMKIFAGSQKDLADVTGALDVSRDLVDRPLLNELVRAYGDDAVRTLRSLLKEPQP